MKITHHAESNYALFPITSAILAKKIFRNTLFLKAPSLCSFFNPLNAQLNPTYQLLALLGSHPIVHVSRIRVNATVHLSYHTKHKSGYSWVRWLGDRSSITDNGNTASLHQYCLQRDSGAYIASLPIITKDKTIGRWRWGNCSITMSVIETSCTQKLHSNTFTSVWHLVRYGHTTYWEEGRADCINTGVPLYTRGWKQKRKSRIFI